MPPGCSLRPLGQDGAVETASHVAMVSIMPEPDSAIFGSGVAALPAAAAAPTAALSAGQHSVAELPSSAASAAAGAAPPAAQGVVLPGAMPEERRLQGKLVELLRRHAPTEVVDWDEIFKKNQGGEALKCLLAKYRQMY